MTTPTTATVRKLSPMCLLVLLGSGLPSLLAEMTGADRLAVGTAQIVFLAVVAVVVHLHPQGRAFRRLGKGPKAPVTIEELRISRSGSCAVLPSHGRSRGVQIPSPPRSGL